MKKLDYIASCDDLDATRRLLAVWMIRVLDAMKADKEIREMGFDLINHGVTNCEDLIIYILDQIEKLMSMHLATKRLDSGEDIEGKDYEEAVKLLGQFLKNKKSKNQ